MRARSGTALADPSDAGGEWVLCLGGERGVVDGLVRCPLLSAPVDVGECLACHLLVGVSGERDDPADCGYSDPAR